MRVDILYKAVTPVAGPWCRNQIEVTYDKKCDTTSIAVDCDLVTLGVAVASLTETYEKFKGGLPPELQSKLDNAIKEALANA